MRVIIFGATGMVGQGVLLECLNHPDVSSVLAVGRRATGAKHAKLEEIIHPDLFDYAAIEDRMGGRDACFFCLGVSSVRMSEAQYHRLTFELTSAAAEMLATLNPNMTFCYISGAGTDSTERGRIMWARVKGKTENHLLQMPFRACYVFRPGYIQPMKGIKSKTRVYRIAHAIFGPVYPLLERIFPSYLMTTEQLGLAMILVVRDGYPNRVLETSDINAVIS